MTKTLLAFAALAGLALSGCSKDEASATGTVSTPNNPPTRTQPANKQGSGQASAAADMGVVGGGDMQMGTKAGG